MRKLAMLSILLLMFSTAGAHRLVRLYDMTGDAVLELFEEGYDVANYDIRRGYADIMLPEDELDQAAMLSHEYELLPREWGELLPENSRDAGYYYDPAENWTFWTSLSTDYPDLVNYPVTIGQSYQDRDIYMIEMTSPAPGYKTPIYLSSLIHAREPGGNSVLIDFAMWLTSNYDGGDTRAAYILDHAAVYFVPVANPDGYEYNMPNGGYHRKNMNFTLGDGIDLNRNWGYQWGYDNFGSSGNPNDETYRGTAPFSEPETQVQRDFLIDLEPAGALNYHTCAGCLLYPWGYEDLYTPDDALFSSWGGAMTAENNYEYGTAWEVLYNANGVQVDWCYCGDSVPKIYAMTPEVADNGFWGSQNDTTEIERICDECRPMNILFCMFLIDYIGIEDGGDIQVAPLLAIDQISPNPAYSSVTFGIASPGSSAGLEIFDTSGRMVYSSSLEDLSEGRATMIWDIPSRLPAGVYTAAIHDDAGGFTSRRFTVVR